MRAVIFFAMLLFSTIALSQDFRGFHFGSPIPDKSGFYLSSQDGRVSTYQRKGEYMKIGDANLESVKYSCIDGKLIMVTITAKPLDELELAGSAQVNGDLLYNVFSAKYGDVEPQRRELKIGDLIAEDSMSWTWRDNGVEIIMTYIRSETEIMGSPSVIVEYKHKKLYDKFMESIRSDYKSEQKKIADKDL